MRTKVFTPEGGDRPGVPDICILITDGVPTREEDMLMPEVETIKKLNITIFAVGVTHLVRFVCASFLVDYVTVAFESIVEFDYN